MTVYLPGGSSLGFAEAADFSPARPARASGNIFVTSGEFAFCQPEESASSTVTENSARVCWCDRNNPRLFASAVCIAPLEKIPATVCLRLVAAAQTRATALARSCGVNSAVESKNLDTRDGFCWPGIGNMYGMRAWLFAIVDDAATTCASDASSVRFVVARAVRPSKTVRT